MNYTSLEAVGHAPVYTDTEKAAALLARIGHIDALLSDSSTRRTLAEYPGGVPGPENVHSIAGMFAEAREQLWGELFAMYEQGTEHVADGAEDLQEAGSPC